MKVYKQIGLESCKLRGDKLCPTGYLGYEKDEQGLAEVAQNACHGNCHSSKVGKSVPYKYV